MPDDARGDLVIADESGQDRQSGGVGTRPPVGTKGIRAQVPGRAAARSPVGALRAGVVQLVEAARVLVDHEHVAVTGRIEAAFDQRARRDRVADLVGLVGVVEGDRRSRRRRLSRAGTGSRTRRTSRSPCGDRYPGRSPRSSSPSWRRRAVRRSAGSTRSCLGRPSSLTRREATDRVGSDAWRTSANRRSGETRSVAGWAACRHRPAPCRRGPRGGRLRGSARASDACAYAECHGRAHVGTSALSSVRCRRWSCDRGHRFLNPSVGGGVVGYRRPDRAPTGRSPRVVPRPRRGGPAR